MSDERATVLCVDDEERILRSLRMQFRSHYDVLVTTSGRQALQIVRQQPVHVLISDQRMPEMLGVELLRRVRELSPMTMRLLLTGYSDLPAIIASVNEGEIFRFIEKPWQPQYLQSVVEQAAQAALRAFSPALAQSVPAAPAKGLTLLVIDEDPSTQMLVHEAAAAHAVLHAPAIEPALALLSEREVAVVIAELAHRRDDVAGALKTLKQCSPSTLAIVTANLRDARSLIELINQGQIFRFLPQPLSRELLRRSLEAAITHHRRLQAAPILLRRHAVAQAPFEPMSLSARLLDYWKRIRENGRRQRVG
jgi:serine/threonine-protein kinase